MAILASVTPLVEQLSIDEAFLDVARRAPAARHGHRDRPGSSAPASATRPGLVVSVGVATTKFLAKLASDLSKPDGLLTVAPGDRARVPRRRCRSRRLWGVGPATLPAPRPRWACTRSARSPSCPESTLIAALGASLGRRLLAARAQRRSAARSCPSTKRSRSAPRRRSRSTCTSARECDREMVRLVDRAVSRLRKANFKARTITLKIRYGNFKTKTRSRTVPEATDVSTVFLATAASCSTPSTVARGVRLLGVSLSQLEARTETQGALALGDEEAQADAVVERRAAVERAVDEVRDRFGSRSVGPASLVPGTGEREVDRDADRAGRVRSHRHRARLRAAAAHRCEAHRRGADAVVRRRREARGTDRPPPRWRSRRVGRGASWPASTWCGCARGRPRISKRSRSRSRPGSPVFCEKPLGPDLASSERVAASLERVPHQVGLVLRRVAGVSTRGGAHRERRVRTAPGNRAARRPVLPDPGLLRLDVAQGRCASRRGHAHRAFDPRHRRVALAARRSRVGQRATRHRGTGIPESKIRPRSRLRSTTARSPSSRACGIRCSRGSPVGTSRCSARAPHCGPTTTIWARCMYRPAMGPGR